MLSDYQLNIVDLSNIIIGNVKKLVLKNFQKKCMKTVMKSYENFIWEYVPNENNKSRVRIR